MLSNSDSLAPTVYVWYVTEFPALKNLEAKQTELELANNQMQLAMDQLAADYMGALGKATEKHTEALHKAAAQVQKLNEATTAAQEGWEFDLDNGEKARTLVIHEVPSFRTLKGDYLDNIVEGPEFRVDALEL